MERILCLAIGYLFGLFQTAYIYGKMHGIDIRQHGSGNAGTTNTLRVLGTKAGLIVFAGDVLKCVLAVVVCSILFGKKYPEMVYLWKMYAAAGAILGHNFPFYLNFKGGKGISSGIFSSRGSYVFRHFSNDTLCFPGIVARIRRLHDTNRRFRADRIF